MSSRKWLELEEWGEQLEKGRETLHVASSSRVSACDGKMKCNNFTRMYNNVEVWAMVDECPFYVYLCSPTSER